MDWYGKYKHPATGILSKFLLAPFADGRRPLNAAAKALTTSQGRCGPAGCSWVNRCVTMPWCDSLSMMTVRRVRRMKTAFLILILSYEIDAIWLSDADGDQWSVSFWWCCWRVWWATMHTAYAGRDRHATTDLQVVKWMSALRVNHLPDICIHMLFLIHGPAIALKIVLILKVSFLAREERMPFLCERIVFNMTYMT